MGGGSDGQRDIHRLAVSVRAARVSGDILVIDIRGTLDIPVVSRHTARGQVVILVLVANVVAVVDDGLRAVHEVT